MVDTEHVLEQMRAANPAPSLEQLAADDLDLVRNIVARERSATTIPMTEPPQARPDRPVRRWSLRPVLVGGLAFILVLGTLGAALLLFRGVDETATGGFTCPSGSTPDQPGPADQIRPRDLGGFTAFDQGSGRVLMLADGILWTFDVCTNTWTFAPGLKGIGLTEVVYDIDSERAIVFGYQEEGVAQVWAYEPATQTWTRKSDWAFGPPPESYYPVFPHLQAVYDPVTGLVVARDISTSRMWTYDVDTDTRTEVDQGPILPPDAPIAGPTFDVSPDAELLTYDASVDRLILYVSSRSRDFREVPGTWEFDIRAGRWEKQETDPPDPGFGWFPSGEEFAYDKANQVSVLFSFETLATYDASEHRWTVLQGGSGPIAGEAIRGYFAMTYDPVNERILVFGGSARTGDANVEGGWREQDDVIAFDVATGEWITLLEPTTS